MTIICTPAIPEETTPAAPAAGTVTEGKAGTPSAPEATASEQNETEASETPETESTETSETEQTGEGSEQETDPADKTEQGQAAPRNKGGFQRKISKLTARVTRAEQRAAVLEQLLAEKAAGAPKNEPAPAKPAAEGKPDPNKFDNHADWIEAVADWKAEQKLKDRDQKQEQTRIQTEQQRLVQTYQERAQAFAAKQADFNEVLAEVDGIPLSPTVERLILESGPELAYELAQDPDEFERVNKLGPLAAAKEMGKLEARIASRASGVKNTEQKITKAPAPLAPVGAGKGSVKKTIYDSNLSQREFEQLMREQRKRRQG